MQIQLRDQAYQAAHEAVVNNPYWYSDRPQMLGERFNAANTRRRAAIFIEILRRAARRRNERHLSLDYLRLADKLSFCSVQRCGLAACLVCLRAFQQARSAANKEVLIELADLYRYVPLHHATIIPREIFYPCGDMHEFNHIEFSRHLVKRLEFAGVTQPFLGSIDFSFEDSPDFGKYLQPHLHVPLFAPDPEELKVRLLEEFPRYMKHDYPVDVAEVYDLRFLPYVHKGLKIIDLLRTGRTPLPELLLLLGNLKPLDLIVTNGLVLSAQDGGLKFAMGGHPPS